MMERAIIIFITAASKAEGRRIAKNLVDKQLAACVNIVAPLESIYTWQGKVESAKEVLLIVKTTSGLFDKVKESVKRMHSYQCPEIIAFSITKGDEGYLKWIKESVVKK